MECASRSSPPARPPAEADLATFRREVHLLASLRHRNIVQARSGFFALLKSGWAASGCWRS